MRIGWNTENPPSPALDDVVSEEYLVTYDTGGLDIARWTNVNRFWVDHVSDWHWECAQYCKVIAWMLLPRPYEEVKNEAN